ncbi:MAG: NAD(P)H-hydrate dehydratase, partial [Candidatus Hadarchaeales archaeon]
VDLAIVAAPEKVAWTINSFSPDLITVKLPCEELEASVIPSLKEELAKATALVIGPGLSGSQKVLSAVREIIEILKGEFSSLPAVFDADALKPFAEIKQRLEMPWILTPHAGEFRLLTGEELPGSTQERAEAVAALSQRMGVTVLLKGHADIIASPDGRVKINRTGNPGMTVGGTGDVLAGVVGAFLAQKNSPFAAAAAGAWVCGRAGDLCLKEIGYEFTASDVINMLPYVFREIRRRR